MFSGKGVLLFGYSVENGKRFGSLPTIDGKIAGSREAVEKLHPGRGQRLARPVYISWGRIPYNLGSRVAGTRRLADSGGTDFYARDDRDFLLPDDRVYFAGDHCSRSIARQEGAALSAQRTARMIVDRIKQSRRNEPANWEKMK
jgi:monoamine oxidase